MRKGPPPTPVRLRVLRGTPSKRPLPSDVPDPPVEAPPCPANLSAAAKREWKRIAALAASVLATVDRQALALLCGAYATWDEAMAEVRKSGLIGRPRGQDRDRPDLRADHHHRRLPTALPSQHPVVIHRADHHHRRLPTARRLIRPTIAHRADHHHRRLPTAYTALHTDQMHRADHHHRRLPTAVTGRAPHGRGRADHHHRRLPTAEPVSVGCQQGGRAGRAAAGRVRHDALLADAGPCRRRPGQGRFRGVGPARLSVRKTGNQRRRRSATRPPKASTPSVAGSGTTGTPSMNPWTPNRPARLPEPSRSWGRVRVLVGAGAHLSTAGKNCCRTR